MTTKRATIILICAYLYFGFQIIRSTWETEKPMASHVVENKPGFLGGSRVLIQEDK